jgi:DNA-binding CsgD family transcriptional regulator
VSKSNRLRLSDVRRAFRLVGECLELGDAAAGWLTHAGDGFRSLIGADVTLATLQPPGPFLRFDTALAQYDSGWASEANRSFCLRYIGGTEYFEAPDHKAYRALGRSNVTAARSWLVPDREWYRSLHFHEHWKTGGVDHYVVTVREAGSGTATTLFNLSRAVGRRRFTRREVRLVRLVHEELGRLIGGPLSVGPDPAVGLSPRLRRTLDCLLDGDSEKQAAVRMGISPHTAHQYVKELYLHFGVASRGELHARYAARIS